MLNEEVKILSGVINKTKFSQRDEMKNRKIGNTAALLVTIIFVVAAFQTSCLFRKKADYNIILITIDTLRADHLGCYGYPRNTSPFIDHLAKNGILFQNAFASSSHTAPSHASIFTSLHPVQHRLLVNGARLHDSAFTMAEMFQDLGYETAGFCSVGFLSNMRQGFDIFDNEKYKKVQYRQAHQTTDSVLDWLSEKKSSDKFFLWVHIFDPHRPYMPPKKCLRRMGLRTRAEKDIFIKYLFEIHKLPVDFYQHRFKLIEDYNNYDAEILFVDREIKRLFNHMEIENLNSHTLWVITSDHGEGLGNHGYKSHGKYIYNEQVHVPLIFYFSDRTYADIKVDNLVRHVDILPTLSDLFGYDLEKKSKFVQGVSLLPLVHNNQSGYAVEYAFYQRRPKDKKARRNWEPGEIHGLQDLNFKYIYHSQGKDEFYDLRKDPFESKNLIDFPSEDKERLKKILGLKYNVLAAQTIEGGESKIDKKFLEELRALGYIR